METTSLLLVAVAVPVAILALGFWIWMLVDCLTHVPSEGNEKLVWVIVIVAMKLIGAIVYYFVRRPRHVGLSTA